MARCSRRLTGTPEWSVTVVVALDMVTNFSLLVWQIHGALILQIYYLRAFRVIGLYIPQGPAPKVGQFTM